MLVALEYVPKCLVTYVKMVGFKGKEIKLLFWISMILKNKYGSGFRALSNVFHGVFSRK